MLRYSQVPVTVQCPVCLCNQARLLYTVDGEQAAQHFVLREIDEPKHRDLRAQIEQLWQRPACDVVQCAGCSFCFVDPYVAGDTQFYRLIAENPVYPAWKWEYQITLEALRALIPVEGGTAIRVLEVGAGDGAFIRRITPALVPKADVLCTEYSVYGRRQIEQYGVACLATDVRRLDLVTCGGSFNVICMFQVLEHLDRLDALFEQLRRLSRRDAHIFIAVPNARRIAFNERFGGLLDMPPNHLGRWNRSCFEILASRHGWDLLKHEIESEGFAERTKGYVVQRYRRRRQEHGTLANRVEQIKPRSLRRVFQVMAVAGYALGSLPGIFALREGGLGLSQWAHLRKQP